MLFQYRNINSLKKKTTEIAFPFWTIAYVMFMFLLLNPLAYLLLFKSFSLSTAAYEECECLDKINCIYKNVILCFLNLPEFSAKPKKKCGYVDI